MTMQRIYPEPKFDESNFIEGTTYAPVDMANGASFTYGRITLPAGRWLIFGAAWIPSNSILGIRDASNVARNGDSPVSVAYPVRLSAKTTFTLDVTNWSGGTYHKDNVGTTLYAMRLP